MDNQENMDEGLDLDFDLDSILNEFGSGSQEDAAPTPPKEEHPPLEEDAAPDASQDAASGPEQDAGLSLDFGPASGLSAPSSSEEESDEDFAKRLDALLGDLPESQQTDSNLENTKVLGDTLDLSGDKNGQDLGDTQVFSPVSSQESKKDDAAQTRRLDTISQIPTAEELPKKDPIPIRAGIQELKRKLVAGPEKRYYELSDEGVFNLQIGIFLNLLVVAVCTATAVMLNMGLVPENRLRLVIFSQVLGMLVSALLGCYQILDGITDLFHGRFTINMMLLFTFLACGIDAFFCFRELRVPCCTGFALEMTFALLARYHRRATEMSQMDTLRRATHLRSIVKEGDYLDGGKVLLRGEGDVDDFLDTYAKPSTPEKIQGAYCVVALIACLGISALAFLQKGPSFGFQVLSGALLAAVPASFFIAITRPAHLLQHRLHMVGSVLCGWQGVKALRGKAYFPMEDADLFPKGSTKLNGVKFYGTWEPEQILSYTSSLISAAGGGLVPLFRNMLKNRGGSEYPVTEFRDYGLGGIGGKIQGNAVLMGDIHFLQSMDVEIPVGTTVSQAVYAAINNELCAVIAISYAKMRSASAGLTSLNGCRKIRPVLLCDDFLLTNEFIHSKFGVNTRRMVFPDRQTRETLSRRQADPEAPVLAMTVRDELVSCVYPITGASALYTATRLGMIIHLLGGIVGLLIMFVLAFQGSADILTPLNVLLYQLIWLVPGWLVTEWARTV